MRPRCSNYESFRCSCVINDFRYMKNEGRVSSLKDLPFYQVSLTFPLHFLYALKICSLSDAAPEILDHLMILYI